MHCFGPPLTVSSRCAYSVPLIMLTIAFRGLFIYLLVSNFGHNFLENFAIALDQSGTSN